MDHAGGFLGRALAVENNKLSQAQGPKFGHTEQACELVSLLETVMARAIQIHTRLTGEGENLPSGNAVPTPRSVLPPLVAVEVACKLASEIASRLDTLLARL